MNELETMILPISDDETFRLVAYKYYDNSQAVSLKGKMKEFKEDLKRFRYVKNLLEKYKTAYSHGTQLIDERLILNHITVLHNLFGNFTAVGLFNKVDPNYWYLLKTFLLFLNLMPNNLYTRDNIKIDDNLMEKLEKL